MCADKRRMLSLAAVLLVTLALFVSFLFISVSAEHECSHDDSCAVCRMIDACIQALHTDTAANGSLSASAPAAAISAAAAAVCTVRLLRCVTLISLKTELRN
ncbi:MAG: hypothetical protein IK990_09210 [Ruminiclostridium sp.]|nr:hypothetical protein [Ruminiclostridium sp.]